VVQYQADAPEAPDALDRTFAALADPTRRAIVGRLGKGAASVSAVAAPFDMSLPAVAKHIAVLERAGLVVTEKRGRTRVCRLQGRSLEAATDWMTRQRSFWERQLDALTRHVENSA
jgi:DNA-binding transcriptional ArsR family regulator